MGVSQIALSLQKAQTFASVATCGKQQHLQTRTRLRASGSGRFYPTAAGGHRLATCFLESLDQSSNPDNTAKEARVPPTPPHPRGKKLVTFSGGGEVPRRETARVHLELDCKFQP